MATEELSALFPVNLFILLAGITYMFCVAQRNGTMTLITEAAIRLVRGRVAAIPGSSTYSRSCSAQSGRDPRRRPPYWRRWHSGWPARRASAPC
jgi:hypothetical protein